MSTKESPRSNVVPDFVTRERLGRFSGVLAEEPPWILAKLIPFLSSKVVIEDYVVARIRELANRGPIVYALKYRSIYDLHFLRIRCASLELPVPCFVFGQSPSLIGRAYRYLKSFLQFFRTEVRGSDTETELSEQRVAARILERGGAAALYLVDEETSRKRFVYPDLDPINALMEIQGGIASSIALVPMVILYDRTQRRTIRPFWETLLGDPDRPGVLRRLLIATRKWTVPELLIGEPVHLIAEFEEFGSEKTWDEVPFEVRTKLTASINDRIRVNRGPERMSRTEIKERVLQDPKVQKALREAIPRDSSTEENIRKKAESYVEEIAGDQRIQYHHFLYYALKWTFAKIFDGVDLRESDFSTLKRSNQEGSLIYVSCHKSHLDYLLIGFFSFINHMAIPYMAAGKNLSFWPVGPILRNSGAFFIRRSFKNLGVFTRLYTSVFEAYLKVLIREKVNINFYIEGGRSRTGKLLQPRVGMLAFLLQAVQEGAVKDLTFVPTFIGYDQVPEEKSYLRELAGGEKQKETFFSVIRAREVFTKRFGKVYIRFHEPVSFEQFCRKAGVDLAHIDAAGMRKVVLDFAFSLMSGIARCGVVNPIDLTAAALLSSGRSRVPKQLFLEAVGHFSRALGAEAIDQAESLDHPDIAVENSLRLFRARGFVSVEHGVSPEHDTIYVIDESRRINVDFYRNSLVNYLWAYSLVAMVLLGEELEIEDRTASLSKRFSLLKNVLAKELILDPLVHTDQLIEGVTRFFAYNKWLDTDLTVIEPSPLQCLRGLLSDLLGVYYLALLTSMKVEGDGIVQKDFAKKMVETSLGLPTGGGDRLVPPVTLLTVDNAMNRFMEMGIFLYRPGRKLLTGIGDEAQCNSLMEYLAKILDWKQAFF